MKLLSLILLGVLFSLHTWAGDTKRNGGDVLLCGHTYRSFDLYEAEATYGYKIKAPAGKTYTEMLQSLIGRLDRYDHTRAELYRQFLKEFASAGRFVTASNFTPVTDIGQGVPLPKDCTIIQTAAQFTEQTPEGQWYIVNQDIWSHLNEMDKAALLLHEFIYREVYRDNNAVENSIGVRYFNAHIFSGSPLTETLKSYVGALGFAALKTFTYRGFTLLLNSGNDYPGNSIVYNVTFQDEAHLQSATLGNHFSVASSRLLQNIKCTEQATLVPADAIHITFDNRDNTYLSSSCVMEITMKETTQYGYILSDSMAFDRSGNLISINTPLHASPDLKLFGVLLETPLLLLETSLDSSVSLNFGPHESLQDIVLVVNTLEGQKDSLLGLDGKNYPLLQSIPTHIEFAQDGKIQVITGPI